MENDNKKIGFMVVSGGYSHRPTRQTVGANHV